MAREHMTSAEWRVNLHEFPDGEGLAVTLAETVSERLSRIVEDQGDAVLAVSGGKTPVRFFQALSRHDIDWSRVTITLVDERFVPPDNDRSNQKLVADNLLRDRAAAARFVPLWSPARSVEEAAAAADAVQSKLPLDVVVLGMGPDGHTASFFPDAADLARLLRPSGTPAVFAVQAASAGEPRLSQSLERLLGAKLLALHIEGADKRRVLERAMTGPSGLPIEAVLSRGNPTNVYWAP